MGTDHPIIFSAGMVNAILREVREPGTGKTETRRLAWRPARTGESTSEGSRLEYKLPEGSMVGTVTAHLRPTAWQRLQPSARLWVREKIHVRPIASAMHAVSYFNEENSNILGGWEKVRLLPYYHKIKRPEKAKWLPSIHMPRDLSRLTLIVESVKIERLQDIDEAAARREGAPLSISGHGPEGPVKTHRTGFVRLWGSLHGTESWLENPHVVAIRFRPILANIDAPEAKAA